MNELSETRQVYWERKILRWERARYSPWLGFYPLSWSIRARLAMAARTIRQRASPNWRILELGCGSGHLAADICAAFPRYSGIDIAANAVAVARRRVPQVRFEAGDVLTAELPEADLTIFLGLTDWLQPQELVNVVRRLKSKYILFSYTNPAAWNPYRLYRLVMDKPGLSSKARTFTDAEIQNVLNDAGYDGLRLSRAGFANPGAMIWAQRHD
jgi:SAM-dependent methyltransferase